MKQVAYNFELACFWFIEHDAADVGGTVVFNGPASVGAIISLIELAPATKFAILMSSALPSGIGPPKRVPLKFATFFMSNGNGNCIFCAINGNLFRWSCESIDDERSFVVDRRFSAIRSIFRASDIRVLRPFDSIFRKFLELPFSSNAPVSIGDLCSIDWHWFW